MTTDLEKEREAIKAAYVAHFGSDAGWRGESGGWFIEGYRAALAAHAAHPNGATIADYEEVLADHRRLVRELDVLLNGEEGAAQQASLGDIVAQVRKEGIKAAPAAPQRATIADHKEKEMLTDDQIKTMVDRFLGWKLPADFMPDAGISFDPVFNKGTPYEMRHEPIGTNLFHAGQAETMIRHMVEGIAAPTPSAAPQKQPSDEDIETLWREATKTWDTSSKPHTLVNIFARAPLSRYGAAPQPAGRDAREDDKTRCSNALREQGKTYPRTCRECGLGPCKLTTQGDSHD